jgi:hypothetical protein
MPKSHVNDPKRWRDNAAEMRLLAEGMKDAATRRTMNRLADGWDKLAYRAEKRALQPHRLPSASCRSRCNVSLITDVAHRSAYRRSGNGKAG